MSTYRGTNLKKIEVGQNIVRNHPPHPTKVGADRICDACTGFAYEQVEPGLWAVCRGCCGSGLSTRPGTREPGTVVLNSRLRSRPTTGEAAGAACKATYARRQARKVA